MEFELIELTKKCDIFETYDIYKHCMYMPSKEKFDKKINAFLNDDSVRIFACLSSKEVKGLIVICFLDQYKIEIIGISVDISARNKGIGSYMINKLVDEYRVNYVLAETDNDSIGFYRKNNFKITEFIKIYDGKPIIRYKCELKKL